MRAIKMVATVVLFLALTGLVIWQQARLRHLAAESAALREQLAQAISAQEQSERLANLQQNPRQHSDDVPPPELLRLRGEVGALRRQLAEALKSGSTQKLAPKTAEPTAKAEGALSSLPILQPALTALQQGDTSTAVSSFLAVDWSAHPLFEADSPLSRSDDQMHALGAHSEADYHAESGALETQLLNLKALAGAVRDAGYDAISKGDTAQAQKDFTALKHFGTALANPDYTLIVQLVGRGYEKEAAAAFAKIGQ
jgi:hypothetical protein